MSSDRASTELVPFFGPERHGDWKRVRCMDCQTRIPDLPAGSYMKDPESHFPICRSCSFRRARAIESAPTRPRIQSGHLRDLVPIC